MVDAPTPKTAPVEVRQEDRDAVAELMEATQPGFVATMTRAGHRDDDPIVQAFARHRIAAQPAPISGDVEAVDVDSLAYSVANAKLGEGPTVRCEGPTEFEIGIAREWVNRVLAALATGAGTGREAWQPVETCRAAAMHVLAARFDHDCGEWIYGVVMAPPIQPFTHWQPLPEPPQVQP